jgi:formiminotetrahydrofolate cyclodeaminase
MIVIALLVGALGLLLIFLIAKLTKKKIKRNRKRREYHKLIQKKMNILAKLSERAPAPISPSLLDNVFKQNFGGTTK